MGEEVREFALHWNNFTDNIVNSFQSLHNNQDLCDVTLAVEGKLLKAHKIVLSICSPYFQEMFNSSIPNQPLFFVLHNMSARLVMNLLEFMYLGSVNVQQSELQAFMKIAESLKVKGLTSSSKNPVNKKSSKEAEKEKQIEPKAGQKRHLRVDEKVEEDDEDLYNKQILDITDLSNDDDQEPEIIDDNLDEISIPAPEISMLENRTIENDQKHHSNLKIASAHSLSSSALSIDYATNESSKKQNFTENPCDSAGSNVTLLSSTSLLHGSCIFNRNNTVATQAGLKTYWLCKSYRMTMCKARCITHQGKVISATGIHNHLPHISNKPSEIPVGHTPNLFSSNPAPPDASSQVFINPSQMQQQSSQQSTTVQTSYNFMSPFMTPTISNQQQGMQTIADMNFNANNFNHHSNIKMEEI